MSHDPLTPVQKKVREVVFDRILFGFSFCVLLGYLCVVFFVYLSSPQESKLPLHESKWPIEEFPAMSLISRAPQ